MSEIPFVNQLGDELERAAERAQRRPGPSHRRRRLGLFALAGALLVSGSALATGLLSGDVEHQATAQVACYDGADPDFSRSVAAVSPEAGTAGASPVELRRAMDPWPADRPLVACAAGAAVAVIPGRDRSACADAGFAALDPAYESARSRVAQLERDILAIEASADCVAPAELVRRVQRLLDRSGWTGWTAAVDARFGAGPCGAVSAFGGDGRRHVFFGPDARRIFVKRGAPRRITELLISADAPCSARCSPSRGRSASRSRASAGASGRCSRRMAWRWPSGGRPSRAERSSETRTDAGPATGRAVPSSPPGRRAPMPTRRRSTSS